MTWIASLVILAFFSRKVRTKKQTMRIERTVRVPTLRFSGYLYLNRLDGVEQVYFLLSIETADNSRFCPKKADPGESFPVDKPQLG
jgi:hypothetical protein